MNVYNLNQASAFSYLLNYPKYAGVSPGKVAVMQISDGTTHCYVMHIIHSGITQSLKVLLEDSASVMVIFNFRNYM